MSLTNIEKNDVDISKLFTYKSEITFLTVDGEPITFYQRVVGDEVQGQAKVYALRIGSKLRENLRDKKWENRKAYLPSFSKLKKDEIVEIIVSLSLQDLSIEAINETQIAVPAELSGDSTLEEQEKHQKEIDDYTDKFSVEVSKNLHTKAESLTKKLTKINKDLLIKKYEESLINQLVSAEFTVAFNNYTTQLATFLDSEYDTSAFKTREDFANAPSKLKAALIHNYQTMEIKSQELKKLPGATQ